MSKKCIKLCLAFAITILASCNANAKTYKLSFIADSNIIAEHQIKNGDKIGELPIAPNKAGYDYVWQIDNTTISSETIFNYGKDMSANALYSAKEYTIVFPDTLKKVTYGQKIGALPEVPIVEGKTNGRWVIEDTVITSETIYNWAKNSSAYAKYDNIVYKLTFEGTETIKNIGNGELIGELPSIPKKSGQGASHYEGYWVIDGQKITEETKYNYFTDKTATVYYYAFKMPIDDGGEIDICSDTVRALFNAKEKSTSLTFKDLICAVVDDANVNGNFDYRTKSYKFIWDEIENFNYATFSISENFDLSNATQYLTFNNYVVLDRLIPGRTYFYEIEGVDGTISIKSDVMSFTVKNGINFLNVDGLENCRDIITFDTQFENKTIKKGMIYRNNNADSITTKGIAQATELLGIKTELDLREKVYWKETGSYFGESVQYKHVSNENGGVLYTGDNPDTKKVGLRAGGQSIKEELMVFTEQENYPIDIHCAIGRDRTGTLTMILQGLLGMSAEDILCDYLSSLLTKTAKIDDIDKQTASDYFSTAYQTLEYIKSKTGEEELSKALEVYLTADRGDDSTVGLTIEQVQNIRNIMLEDVK